MAASSQLLAQVAVGAVALYALVTGQSYLPMLGAFVVTLVVARDGTISRVAGVVALIVGGVLEPDEAYDAVSWDVIFLLAGMIPLGIALERSGGAAVIADLIVAAAGAMPPVGVVALFYLVTAVVTNLVSNNATVVLLLPVAVDVATQLGATVFSFVLAVTFAASTSFLSPAGYQTNLMVYRPGGYRVVDYLRLGAPLQLLLAVTVTLGIWAFWGV